MATQLNTEVLPDISANGRGGCICAPYVAVIMWMLCCRKGGMVASAGGPGRKKREIRGAHSTALAPESNNLLLVLLLPGSSGSSTRPSADLSESLSKIPDWLPGVRLSGDEIPLSLTDSRSVRCSTASASASAELRSPSTTACKVQWSGPAVVMVVAAAGVVVHGDG